MIIHLKRIVHAILQDDMPRINLTMVASSEART
jgi:hypothetical protein